MESVTVTREFDADAAEVRAAMGDVGPFMRAAGFDEVDVADGTVRVANEVGPVRIELRLEVVEDSETVLAYDQREGIFEEMTTRYELVDRDGATTVEATTEFALDVAAVGSFLDATVIAFQRRRELNAQFDYLEDRIAGD
ncbi:SRPBCC family protein [Haloplanus sp. GCM10025708]|uniref:SRPBCC family protein n=1 Tax=Haloferacaceae TaxID=1644056 RepID=UPI00361A01B6